MNAEETGKILALAASYDRRKVGEAEIIAWHAAVGDLNFEDSRAAVVAHYTDTTDWLMPAHVRSRVMTARKQRIHDAEIPPPPPELLDDTTAWRAAVRAAAIAVADGRDPETAMAAIVTQRRRELEAR